MPHELQKLTPNLVVANVDRSIAFYRGVLGLEVDATVPESPPYVFASLQAGPVSLFLNAPEPAIAEYPALKDRPIGGTFTLFIEVSSIGEMYNALKDLVTIAMPLEKKWYGLTEFAIEDPDGYLITFAERMS